MPATSTDRLQGLTTSVAVKAPCKTVTTTAISLNGEQTVGGVACATGDRVLVAIVGGSINNGIWVVDTGNWARARDFDGNRDAVSGTMVIVGVGGESRLWQIVTTDPITIGSTDIEFRAIDPVGAANGGYDQALNYVARTVGATLQDRGIDLMNSVTSEAERAAIKAGTSTTDHTAILQAALVLQRKVFLSAGGWNISEVELPSYGALEGEAPYVTNINVMKAISGTNRGLYLRLSSEGETGLVLKNFSLMAKDYITLGNHSYGLNLANVAHAYLENVHAVGFERNLYLEDALINTFMRCRFHGGRWGVYIDGTEPLAGTGPGANKNNFYDCKITSNGTASGGGGGVLLTGVSAYQNAFYGGDITYNAIAISNDNGGGGPHVFDTVYFECHSGTPDNNNRIRTMAGTHIVLRNPIWGNAGPGTAAYYLDPNYNEGLVEITGGHSNSQNTRVLPPKFGRYEMVGSGGHDVASTSLQTMIDYWKSFIPVSQALSVICGAAVMGYVYGVVGTNGFSVRNTFDNNPNDTASWVAPNGTMGQSDPIGGTTAVALTGTFQMLRSIGTSVLPICCQVFAKVTTGTPGEFQLEYWNNGVMRQARPFSFAGPTDWMLLSMSVDLAGLTPAPTNTHEFRITGGAGKVTVWWPQISQATRVPQPIMPLESSGSKFGSGQGVPPSFNTPIRMVGLCDYELPKVVKRVAYAGGAATAATFPVLVDAVSPALGRCFELIVRENFGTTNFVTTVYNVSLSYVGTASTAACIKQVSQSIYGAGGASRVTASVSATGANAEKSITLTNSDVVTVQATIREIT